MRWQHWIYTVPLRLRSLLRGDDVEQELAEEMRYHLERRIEEYVASGLSPEEARHAAMRAMEGIEQQKEKCRDMRKINFVEDFWQDLRYGARMLRRSPGFTAIVMLTLGLGIGANTAIFSVVDAILLRPLPFTDAGDLVIVWETNAQTASTHNTVSPPNFLDWESQNRVFSGMSYVSDLGRNLTGNGEPEQVIVQYVSANFFSVLGVTPIIGPGFTPENGLEGKDSVVVVGYELWKRRFASDPAIVGKTIDLNGKPQTVVGVAPKNFGFFIKQGTLTGSKPQLWSPWVLPAELRPALLILLGAVTFVLLVACANVSSLLLARAAGREREIGIRTAIGASRWRMARQLLTESALLAVLGGGIGIVLAVWATNVLLAASPANLLDMQSAPIDWRVLAFACGITLIAGLLFGFLPSYISARGAIAEALKEGVRAASAGSRRGTLRRVLVVAQISLALVLLVGSGLLIRSFVRLVAVDPGFEAENLLTFSVTLPNARYGTNAARVVFFRQFLERARNLQGVRSVSMDSFPPLSGLGAATSVRLTAQPSRAAADLPVAAVRIVGADYFPTMGIALRAGRTFDASELAEMRLVAVINQAFADQYLPGINPLGQQMVVHMKSQEESENAPSEIVGVVGDVHLMGLDTPAQPTVYWPHPELAMSRMTILVRAFNEPAGLVSALRDELRQMDRDQPMAGVATM